MDRSIVAGRLYDEHLKSLSRRSEPRLPCLYKNNSNEPVLNAAAKSAFALKLNVLALIQRFGINQVGFLTFTFKVPVLDMKEAQRRFNCLATRVLRDRYQEYICVVGRMKNGRIHFHLLLVSQKDIRDGANTQEFDQKKYTSANSALRDEWAFWRATAREYELGRTELLPIKKNAQAIACYMARHLKSRWTQDRGARLVRYSKGAKTSSTRFCWYSPRAITFQQKKAKLRKTLRFDSDDDFARMFGPRWMYFLFGIITEIDLDEDGSTEAVSQADASFVVFLIPIAEHDPVLESCQSSLIPDYARAPPGCFTVAISIWGRSSTSRQW